MQPIIPSKPNPAALAAPAAKAPRKAATALKPQPDGLSREELRKIVIDMIG